MKLALGTAQFGSQYGVANAGQRVSLDETLMIIERSKYLGIDLLDTAISYGDSELNLGNIGILDWRVITKLPTLPNNYNNIYDWVRGELLSSFSRLGVTKIYGLLLHHPQQLLTKIGPELYDALQLIKSEGYVKKIGISVYGPSEIDEIYHRFPMDIVQVPLNVIDHRIQETGWDKEFKKLGIEVHSRSSFLQGLLLMPKEARPSKFNHWANFWKEWEDWLNHTGLSRLQACIGYVNSLDFVDHIIVGVDSVKHLDEIFEASCGSNFEVPDFSIIQDKRLLNPVFWSQL